MNRKNPKGPRGFKSSLFLRCPRTVSRTNAELDLAMRRMTLGPIVNSPKKRGARRRGVLKGGIYGAPQRERV